MRFSLNFVKEFLKINLAPKKLADTLTMAGMEVEYLERKGSDWLFDIEVTTNRYDWLSIIGVTREIAACLNKKLKIKYPPIRRTPGIKDRKINIEDLRDCPFYIARVLRQVKVGDSPSWLQERVGHCEINSVNNIVDITNYFMLKWGNPLHAFDEDKIEGDIHVRRAKKGEVFVGIDLKERILDKENLVIADEKKIIALAGVMGAKNTEVDESSKNIFLEAAIFSPLAVRRSRRAAGLDTESSYRFERRVFPDYLEYASCEAAKLIEKIAKGTFVGYAQAGKKPPLKTKRIPISLSHLESCLGSRLTKAKIKNILSGLDFKVKDLSKEKILVSAPYFRFDIQREVDIFEEISRINGYSKIEPKIPFLIRQSKEEDIYEFKNKLRTILSFLGLREIITYSIEADNELKKLEEKEFIKILNPLRKQENSLRSTLLSGMIKSVNYNLNRNQTNLRFFEVANIYFKNKGNFCEIPTLSLGASGGIDNFFYLKRVIEQIFNYLHIDKFELKEENFYGFSNALKVISGKEEVGFVGKLDQKLKNEFDLKEDLFFSQLAINSLMKQKRVLVYKPFSPYPAIDRDISIALSRSSRFKDVEEIIRLETKQHLAKLQIVDFYKGKDIPKGSFAFTLRVFYQSKTKTLTSQEVDTLHGKIREKLSRREGIILR